MVQFAIMLYDLKVMKLFYVYWFFFSHSTNISSRDTDMCCVSLPEVQMNLLCFFFFPNNQLWTLKTTRNGIRDIVKYWPWEFQVCVEFHDVLYKNRGVCAHPQCVIRPIQKKRGLNQVIWSWFTDFWGGWVCVSF